MTFSDDTILWISTVPPGKRHGSTLVQAMTLFFHILIHHSLIILQSDAIYRVTSSIVKQIINKYKLISFLHIIQLKLNMLVHNTCLIHFFLVDLIVLKNI